VVFWKVAGTGDLAAEGTAHRQQRSRPNTLPTAGGVVAGSSDAIRPGHRFKVISPHWGIPQA
jgi:hypothetical protein